MEALGERTAHEVSRGPRFEASCRSLGVWGKRCAPLTAGPRRCTPRAQQRSMSWYARGASIPTASEGPTGAFGAGESWRGTATIRVTDELNPTVGKALRDLQIAYAAARKRRASALLDCTRLRVSTIVRIEHARLPRLTCVMARGRRAPSTASSWSVREVHCSEGDGVGCQAGRPQAVRLEGLLVRRASAPLAREGSGATA